MEGHVDQTSTFYVMLLSHFCAVNHFSLHYVHCGSDRLSMGLCCTVALIGSLWALLHYGSSKLFMDLCYIVALIGSLWVFVTLWFL